MILVLITKIARLSGSGKCYIVQLFVFNRCKKEERAKADGKGAPETTSYR